MLPSVFKRSECCSPIKKKVTEFSISFFCLFGVSLLFCNFTSFNQANLIGKLASTSKFKFEIPLWLQRAACKNKTQQPLQDNSPPVIAL